MQEIQTLIPALCRTGRLLLQELFEQSRRIEHIVSPANEQNLDRLAVEVSRQSVGMG
jgi:hypothetical protein